MNAVRSLGLFMICTAFAQFDDDPTCSVLGSIAAFLSGISLLFAALKVQFCWVYDGDVISDKRVAIMSAVNSAVLLCSVAYKMFAPPQYYLWGLFLTAVSFSGVGLAFSYVLMLPGDDRNMRQT